nr:MAG TPA: hypothetical protein [Caudoviricetes sp.]
MTVSPGSSASCGAVAISGTVRTAGCSTRMAGTICRMLGGTTAVANRVSLNFPSRLPSAFGDMREGLPRPCRKSDQERGW